MIDAHALEPNDSWTAQPIGLDVVVPLNFSDQHGCSRRHRAGVGDMAPVTVGPLNFADRHGRGSFLPPLRSHVPPPKIFFRRQESEKDTSTLCGSENAETVPHLALLLKYASTPVVPGDEAVGGNAWKRTRRRVRCCVRESARGVEVVRCRIKLATTVWPWEDSASLAAGAGSWRLLTKHGEEARR
jgi:hypothetical protein